MCLSSGHCLLPDSLSCTPFHAHSDPASQSKSGSTTLCGCSYHKDASGCSVAQSRMMKAGHRCVPIRPTREQIMARQTSNGSPLPPANRSFLKWHGVPKELLGDAFSRVPQHLLSPLQCSCYSLEGNVSLAAVQTGGFCLPESPPPPQ